MQLLSDSISVLGSRLGLAVHPYEKISYLIRHGAHPGIPFNLNAGIMIKGRRIILPFGSDDEIFDFCDQQMTPTTLGMTGIDTSTGLKIKMTVTVPFRPRDEEFSTTPAMFIRLSVSRLEMPFRWKKCIKEILNGIIFIEFDDKVFDFDLDPDEKKYINVKYNEYNDRIIAMDGDISINKPGMVNIQLPFNLNPGDHGPGLTAIWCAYDQPVLKVLNDHCQFKYTRFYKSLDEVAEWAENNTDEVFLNSLNVDKIIMNHNIGEYITNLMSYTLHSWLMNTWWVLRPDGSDWFCVWEGVCYFHSTLDLEFTTGPFYLTLWPELLEYELDEWPYFTKPGEVSIGNRGEGTVFLSHDFGQHLDSSGQIYPHEMEVEENTNYIILSFAHWMRTGNCRIITKHSALLRKCMDFILACDTTGNGIPDLGCANTIDDASPAVQYGKEQIYLGVKSMASCICGYKMLDFLKQDDIFKYMAFADKARDTIENSGWKEDHYIVSLSKIQDGIKDPWTGEMRSGGLEGWDAYHIYTSNGLAILDMVNFDSGLDGNRLATDLKISAEKTMTRYGSRHTSHTDLKSAGVFKEGMASGGTKIGWISMNMVRDIAAGFKGIDLFDNAYRYWDWQTVTNCRDITMFFETFYGNNLHFYPRGTLVFAYFDAISGHSFDMVTGRESFSPVRGDMKVPLLNTADWKNGKVEFLETGDAKTDYKISSGDISK